MKIGCHRSKNAKAINSKVKKILSIFSRTMVLFYKLIIILVQNSLLIYQKVISMKTLRLINAEIIISLSIANQRYLNRKSLQRYPKTRIGFYVSNES